MLLWLASWSPTTSGFWRRICETTTGRRVRQRLCSPLALLSKATDEMLKLATRIVGGGGGASAGGVAAVSVIPVRMVAVEQSAAERVFRRRAVPRKASSGGQMAGG